MFFKKANKIDSRIDTLVGADTRIEGDLHFSGGLRVDGAIRGDVTEQNGTPSTLIISEHGSIEGAVTAAKIVLNGKVIGTVKSSHFIELQTKARITGDLHYKSLEMHTGAVIEGKLVYIGDNVLEDTE
ncbi:MAG TPA: polymer-forming cytoskeletal protein [Methylotenera sp.]|nr:polymer-forming cytoskeletal protein [Methylotenera sp.]HPV45655.1 polymer-forming cytoskeletal protein [Methylotenera sp.]